MGTRFMCTVESPVHHNIKERIVAGDENDTELVLRRWKNIQRFFKNGVMANVLKVEKTGRSGEFSEVAPFVSGKRGREVFLNGDSEYGVWTAGQSIGLIHDIPTCNQLITRIEKEAMDAMTRVRSMRIGPGKL